MYLLLLVFGALLTAAGVVLSASGISIHERAFDTTILTPGIVAVIGGLVLIGLGLALRVLQRIENVLATQPMPRSARFKESAETIMAPEFPLEPARASIPRTAARTPLSTRLAAASAQPAAAEPPKDFADTLSDTLFPAEALAEQAPAEASPLDKAETVQGAEKDLGSELAAGLAAALALDAKPAGPDLSLLPVAELSAGNDLGLLKTGRAGRRLNGTTPVRTTPRLDLSARFPLASDRHRCFRTFVARAPERSVLRFNVAERAAAATHDRAGRAAAGAGADSRRFQGGAAGKQRKLRCHDCCDRGCTSRNRAGRNAASGQRTQIGCRRRYGLYAFLRRLDRSCVASGNAAVRLDIRTAPAHRAKRAERVSTRPLRSMPIF